MSISRITLVPKSLALAASAVAPSKTQIMNLYREHLKISNSFESYNFREYFVRRTKRNFREILSGGPIASITEGGKVEKVQSLESGSEPDSIYAPVGVTVSTPNTLATLDSTPDALLNQWYQQSLEDLAILTRSALINRLYEGQKLVVEGRIIPEEGIDSSAAGAPKVKEQRRNLFEE